MMLLLAPAWAFTGEELTARVRETASLREMSGMAAEAPPIPAELYTLAADGNRTNSFVTQGRE